MVEVGQNKHLLPLLVADSHQEEPSSPCLVLVEEKVVTADLPVMEEVLQIPLLLLLRAVAAVGVGMAEMTRKLEHRYRMKAEQVDSTAALLPILSGERREDSRASEAVRSFGQEAED